MKKIFWILTMWTAIAFAQNKEAAQPYNDGIGLYNKGKFAEAIPKFQKTIETDPKFARAYYLKGVCLWKTKSFKQAIETLKQSVLLDSTNAKAWEVLGVLYIQNNQTMDAQKSYQHAVKLDSRLGDAQFGLGSIYMENGNYVKAAEAFQHAAQVGGKKQGEAYMYWGVCANQFGDYETAMTALEKAVSMVKSDYAYYQLGHACVHAKKFDKAVEYGEKSIKLGKKNAGAVYVEVIGEAYEGLGKNDKAKDAYAKAMSFKDWKDAAKSKMDKLK